MATDESAGAADDVSDLVSDEELRALLVALAETTPHSGRRKRIGVREEATVISLAYQHPEGMGRLEAQMFQRDGAMRSST